MDTSIYVNRAKELNKELSDLIGQIGTVDDDDKNALMHDIKTLSDIEEANADILLRSRELDLKEREIEEKKAIEKKAQELKEMELKIEDKESDRRYEIDKLKSENEVNRLELDRQELERRMQQDIDNMRMELKKDKTEHEVTYANILMKTIDFCGGIISGALALYGIKQLMAFEKSPNGGIINQKFTSPVFSIFRK